MKHLKGRALLLALLLGGVPLVTFVTCDQRGNSGGFDVFSTNNELGDFFFGGDDDDDDD